MVRRECPAVLKGDFVVAFPCILWSGEGREKRLRHHNLVMNQVYAGDERKEG